MKKLTLLLASLATCASFSAQATVYTVNNNFPSPGQYSSLSTAYSAASAGDTLLIQGSPFDYGSLDVSKSLTLIGPGAHPQTQLLFPAMVDNIQMDASNITVMGLNLSVIYSSSSSITNENIIRNYIRTNLQIQSHYVNTWLVESNIFANAGDCIDFGGYQSIHDIIFRNNIINGYIGSLGYYYAPSYNMYFLHNIFIYNGYLSNTNIATTAYFNDNIFYRTAPKTSSGSNFSCTYSNNISYQTVSNDTSFINGTNIVNKDPKFVSYPSAGADFAITQDFHLQSTSPGIGAASDGTDIGIYGGTAVYNQTGIPAGIPFIKKFTITGSNTVPSGGTLNINVTSKVVK